MKQHCLTGMRLLMLVLAIPSIVFLLDNITSLLLGRRDPTAQEPGQVAISLGEEHTRDVFNEAESNIREEDNAKRILPNQFQPEWGLRLALSRATGEQQQLQQFTSKIEQTGAPPRIAVLLQVGNVELWNDLLMCTANIATAATMQSASVDVFVSLHEQEKQGENVTSVIEKSIASLGNSINSCTISYVQNAGADVAPFIHELKMLHKSNINYDYLLKMHTKTDPIWRERSIQSLCGTPEQVLSAWAQFNSNQTLDMIAPLGTVFNMSTLAGDIFPHISRKYNWAPETKTTAAFDDDTRAELKRIHKLMFAQSEPLHDHDLAIVAGTTFWVRSSALHFSHIQSSLTSIQEEFTVGYSENGSLEHLMERLFPTEIVARKRQIAELPPAPRVLALYFPQYHRIPENDRFWLQGFTEWSLLQQARMKHIQTPLPPKKGGLGYYNLLDKQVRKKQAEMAKAAGLTGFVFYHYWFSGAHSPACHKVLYKVLEAMLLDGEPNIPFMLSWANEPWDRRWSGQGQSSNVTTLLSQEYGDKTEWKKHFEYLIQFFKHPNYITIEGKPVFVIYRLGHVAQNLKPMLDLWREMAKQHGLPGIHFLHTVGSFYAADKETSELEVTANLDGAFHFWPAALPGTRQELYNLTASTHDLQLNVSTQYWGAFAGFDRRPRVPTADPIRRSVAEFSDGLSSSFTAMSKLPARDIGMNFFFITAWNEWNEQAVLEPGDLNMFGYLTAIHTNLMTIPARILNFL